MKTTLKSKFKHGKLIFLAPMEGITDHIYRDLAVKYMEMDVICTESIRLSGDHFTPKQIKDKINLYPDTTLSVQLMGDNPKLFAAVIPHIEEKGVKVIDLNLGCPSPKVNRKGCGVAMLTNLALLKEVVSSMRVATKGILSCKMRAGWDNEDKALEITNILEGEGVDFITVHPRTKVQRYKGHSNWDLIAEIKATRSIPIIGNGDIFKPSDAKRMIDHTNCDGIMMGRGVLRDPLLMNKVNAYLTGTHFDVNGEREKKFYLEYITKLVEAGRYEGAILGKIKEHFSNVTKRFNHREAVWAEIKTTEQLSTMIETISSLQFNELTK